MRRAALVVRFLALTLGLTLAAGAVPAAAAGQLVEIGKVVTGSAQLSVDTYTDGDTVGLIGLVDTDGKRISFAFRRDEWLALIALWKKTAAMPAGNWKMVGSMAEVGTTVPSFLIMYAGPAYSVVIADPTHSIVFSLARADAASFESALGRALDRLSS
jgi:hypothetical protein